jgi:hypothetical protein
MVAFLSKHTEVAMELMDLMMAGSAMADGVVAFDAGTALWLMMMVTLVGSGLGIALAAYPRRAFDLGVLRRPKGVGLATTRGQLCEAGGA